MNYAPINIINVFNKHTGVHATEETYPSDYTASAVPTI